MALTGFFILLAILLDQSSKLLVMNYVSKYDSISIIDGFLSISNIRNKGIAFGMFQSGGIVLILLILSMIVAVFILSLKYSKYSRWLAFSFGSIIGGGIGNIIDRAVWGSVIDFISVEGFAVFNIGDSFIVTGAVTLCLYILYEEKKISDYDKLFSEFKNTSEKAKEKETYKDLERLSSNGAGGFRERIKLEAIMKYYMGKSSEMTLQLVQLKDNNWSIPEMSIDIRELQIFSFGYDAISPFEKENENYQIKQIDVVEMKYNSPVHPLQIYSFSNNLDFEKFSKKCFMNIKKTGNSDEFFRIILLERTSLEEVEQENDFKTIIDEDDETGG